MIDDVLNNITNRITTGFTNTIDFIFDPLWEWYFIGFGVFLVVMVIAYFVPFKWARAALGGVLLLGLAFILGGRTMHEQMKDKLAQAKAREKAASKTKTKVLQTTQKEDFQKGGFFDKFN